MSSESGKEELVSNAEAVAQETVLTITDTAEPVGVENVSFTENNNTEVTTKQPGSIHGTTPVYYTSGGNAQIDQEQVVITRADGTCYVRTPQVTSQPVPQRRIMKKSDLKCLTIFSVIAIFCFFPTGIAALVFSLKTRTAYMKGIETNNLNKAQGYAKKAEKLLVCSLVLGLVVIAISFAVIEHQVFGKDPSYWERRYPGVAGKNAP